MVLIPAGSFVMGRQSASGDADELPVHPVFVSAFYLDQFEVTKTLWDTVKTYADANSYTFSNAGMGVAGNHPVHTVNWFDVVKWCNARSEQAGLTPPEVTPQVVAGMMARDWPGNARALMSAAMRFAMGLSDEVIADASLGLSEQMAQVEQSLLEAALRRAEGHASAAAQALKLPRKTFYDKLARYGLKAEDFRP